MTTTDPAAVDAPATAPETPTEVAPQDPLDEVEAVVGTVQSLLDAAIEEFDDMPPSKARSNWLMKAKFARKQFN